jgi:ABC-type microcin C transport system permease subunit YejB
VKPVLAVEPRYVLRRGCGFLLVTAVLFAGVELVVRDHAERISASDREMGRSRTAFERRRTDVEILALGDSRVYHGVDPQFIHPKAHNFGFPSEPIQSTYWKMKYYLERGDLPRLRRWRPVSGSSGMAA